MENNFKCETIYNYVILILLIFILEKIHTHPTHFLEGGTRSYQGKINGSSSSDDLVVFLLATELVICFSGCFLGAKVTGMDVFRAPVIANLAGRSLGGEVGR